MSHTILDIESIDFNNSEEVLDLAKRILSAADDLGMFVSHKSSSKWKSGVRTAAKEWICRVEEAIDTMNAGDALTVISTFDIIHRIGYNIPANRAYVDRYKLGAFEAYVHGDRTVDQYALFEVISEELRRHNKAYFGRPLDWQTLCLDRWYRNFRTGRSAKAQSTYDSLNQVTALLNTDLWAFEAEQTAFKHRLMVNHLSKTVMKNNPGC